MMLKVKEFYALPAVFMGLEKDLVEVMRNMLNIRMIMM